VIGTKSHGQQCIVDPNVVYQRIDGFGASSAFYSDSISFTVGQINMFFSTNTGIGLSLLRTQVKPGGTANANDLVLMQAAQARGARVWSTPWSPQASFKDNNNTIGGNFLSASNQAYANQLAGYVARLTNSGIYLYALSIQNEPEANVGYTSCHWSDQQFHDFIPYLYNALVASNVSSTKIMLPESESWNGTYLETTAMTDPTVAAQVGILGNHNYDGIDFNHGATSVPDAPETYGKALWQTEVCTGDAFDGSITNALYWAGRIHLFMTVAQANSWSYWWLIPWGGTDNQGLTDASGGPAKRMYALAQFSRFVRPNYYRISANTVQSTAQISAYKDPSSLAFAIVAINAGTDPINQTFLLTNLFASSVTPWITTSTSSLWRRNPVSIVNSAFTFSLPAMSIVTFTGQAIPSNTAPALVTVSDQTINAGQTLIITNVAVDPDVPSQTLTFSLLSSPTQAELGSSDGVFSWRPLVAQAGTTNLITVMVADDGTPSLSATDSFQVIVNPLPRPVLSSITISGGRIGFMVSGLPGPDYTLATSTNLTTWQMLFTSNPPVLPFMLEDTNLLDPMRAYRIELGP
jgi:glucuronoarabinoxylan endo-1,4-beta-xylanase